MKISKGISSKFHDFRHEMNKYRLRPSKALHNFKNDHLFIFYPEFDSNFQREALGRIFSTMEPSTKLLGWFLLLLRFLE